MKLLLTFWKGFVGLCKTCYGMFRKMAKGRENEGSWCTGEQQAQEKGEERGEGAGHT